MAPRAVGVGRRRGRRGAAAGSGSSVGSRGALVAPHAVDPGFVGLGKEQRGTCGVCRHVAAALADDNKVGAAAARERAERRLDYIWLQPGLHMVTV